MRLRKKARQHGRSTRCARRCHLLSRCHSHTERASGAVPRASPSATSPAKILLAREAAEEVPQRCDTRRAVRRRNTLRGPGRSSRCLFAGCVTVLLCYHLDRTCTLQLMCAVFVLSAAWPLSNRCACMPTHTAHTATNSTLCNNSSISMTRTEAPSCSTTL
jgi:hypothetical protein